MEGIVSPALHHQKALRPPERRGGRHASGERSSSLASLRGRLVDPADPSVEEINVLTRTSMQILEEFMSFTKERSLRGFSG